MSNINFDQLSFTLGDIFTPGAPINSVDLFAGRIDQVNKILDAISQRGYHAILYGERGVGKTSLSNILETILRSFGKHLHFLKTICDTSDNYQSLWKKIFQNITISSDKQGVGFGAEQIKVVSSILDSLPNEITPNLVKNVLSSISTAQPLVIIFDEFDRIKDNDTKTLIADTIKMFSDSGLNITILLIGVADSVDELIEDHNSVERALIQIPMPRMSSNEIREIVNKGLGKAEMTIEDEALGQIISLSQGLPFITHLLALHSARNSAQNKRAKILTSDVEKGVNVAISQSQQSIKSDYYDAMKSQQPGNIFKEVLLACALAEVDEMDCFSASSVKKPLQIITGKSYDFSNFARHLKEFTKPERGEIIVRTGGEKKARYRFVNPLMRQFIIMNGFNDKLIDKEKLKLTRKQSKQEHGNSSK